MVGENERMIRDLISSDPSKRASSGEPSDDLANCGVDLTVREFGDADLIGNSEVVAAERGRGGEGPIRDASRLESKDGVDSCWMENLAFDVEIGTPGEKDGGGLTGVASPGDVMDTCCSLDILGISYDTDAHLLKARNGGMGKGV